MSAINQMLRDLDKRSALAQGAALPGEQPAVAATAATTASNKLAGAYASVRMRGPRTRFSRNLLLAGGVAALLPIAWAATHFERPAAGQRPAVAAAVAVSAVPMPAPTPAATLQAVPALPAPVVVAAVSVAAAELAAPLAAPLVASALPPPPAPEVDGPSPPVAHAVTTVAPPPARNKPVRAAVLPPLLGEDEPVHGATHNASAGRAPKDTRLALASPTVPKDEARIERRPTDARDDLVRAGEAMSIGRTSDAIALLRKVIQAEPDNERARLALLSLLAERGRDDTWRSTLADSARALPKRFGLAAAQGMAESGRFDESLAILQGLPESIRDVRYFSALGATHQQLNQHADAVAAFDAALGIAPGGSPQLPSLLVAQALSLQTLGKLAEARRNLERVRQMPEAAADVREFAARELAHAR